MLGLVLVYPVQEVVRGGEVQAGTGRQGGVIDVTYLTMMGPGVSVRDLTAPSPKEARALFGMVTFAEAAEGMKRLCETWRDLPGYWQSIGEQKP